MKHHKIHIELLDKDGNITLTVENMHIRHSMSNEGADPDYLLMWITRNFQNWLMRGIIENLVLESAKP